MVETYGGEPMTDYEEQLNWADVGVPVPIGDYDTEISKVIYQPDKNGKHMLKVQLTILAAYNPANVEKGVGRMLFDNWPFTQAGGFRPKQFAEASNTELPVMVSKTILEEWGAAIVGTKVGVTVVHRMWNDQTMANISKFKAYQGGGMTEPPPEAGEQPQAMQQPVQQTQQAPQQQVPTVRQALGQNGQHAPANAAPQKFQPAKR